MDALLQPAIGGSFDGRVAVGQSLEMSIPSKDFGPRVSFMITVSRIVNGQRAVVQRIPERHPITVDVPGPDYSSKHWNA